VGVHRPEVGKNLPYVTSKDHRTRREKDRQVVAVEIIYLWRLWLSSGFNHLPNPLDASSAEQRFECDSPVAGSNGIYVRAEQARGLAGPPGLHNLMGREKRLV